MSVLREPYSSAPWAVSGTGSVVISKWLRNNVGRISLGTTLSAGKIRALSKTVFPCLPCTLIRRTLRPASSASTRRALDRKSTRLNSSHGYISYAVFCLKKHKLPGLKPVADDQLLKFTQDGKFVLQIGGSNQSKGNADTKNVHRAADVWVHQQTNEAFVD